MDFEIAPKLPIIVIQQLHRRIKKQYCAVLSAQYCLFACWINLFLFLRHLFRLEDFVKALFAEEAELYAGFF